MDRNTVINLGFALANLSLCLLLLGPEMAAAAGPGLPKSVEYLAGEDSEYADVFVEQGLIGLEEDEQKPEEDVPVIQRGRVFRSLPTEDKVVALTFDDGPRNTLKVLAILEEKQVPATFFLLGNNALTKPHLVKAIVDAGCEVANHTWNHPNLKKLNEENIYWQIQSCHVAYEALGTQPLPFMRPPYGNWNETVQDVCARLNYDLILWDVDSRDWEYNNANKVMAKVMKELKPGSIALFHEGKKVTLEVLPRFIDEARALGYQFVLLSDYIDP